MIFELETCFFVSSIHKPSIHEKKFLNFSKRRIFSNSLLFSGKIAFLQISADFVTGSESSSRQGPHELAGGFEVCQMKGTHTVDNKKTRTPCFQTYVFPVYLRNHLSYKKIIYIYSHPCLRSFQKIWSQNQLIFAKTLFCQKKVSYWKKSAVLKNSKTFFHGSKVQGLNLQTNKFLAQKSSRNLFKSSQMCLPYYCK